MNICMTSWYFGIDFGIDQVVIFVSIMRIKQGRMDTAQTIIFLMSYKRYVYISRFRDYREA